ncbi:hypothetical protein ACIGHF_05105 [Stenotrophomonas sp. NPDC077464]|uniref:hypothetical protein n=1 Tax=unclassified Stenotrophomonas TaxID=196198 RepID=UPI0037D6AFF8
MRTPTALLRICAFLGNQNAKEKVSIRDQLKPITLKEIRNHLPTGWSRPPRIDPDVVVNIPRAKLAALPLHPGLPAAAPPPCIPTSVSNRLASVVDSKDTSWLHHGPGARIPVAQNGRELHPLGLHRPSAAREAPGPMDTLDRQAMSLIQAEKDPHSFFGDVGERPAEAIHTAHNVLMARQTDTLMRDDPCASDSEPTTSPRDSDVEVVSDALTQEPVAASDPWFDMETREIDAFDAMLSDYSEDVAATGDSTPPPPPMPPAMPETHSRSVSPSTRSTPSSPPTSPFSPGNVSPSRPAHADLMAELLAALSQRQPLSPVAQTQKAVRSDVEAAFLGAFAQMDRRFELTKAKDADADASDSDSISGDSGRGSGILEFTTAASPGLVIREAGADHVVADDEWGDSTA